MRSSAPAEGDQPRAKVLPTKLVIHATDAQNDSTYAVIIQNRVEVGTCDRGLVWGLAMGLGLGLGLGSGSGDRTCDGTGSGSRTSVGYLIQRTNIDANNVGLNVGGMA